MIIYLFIYFTVTCFFPQLGLVGGNFTLELVTGAPHNIFET